MGGSAFKGHGLMTSVDTSLLLVISHIITPHDYYIKACIFSLVFCKQ